MGGQGFRASCQGLGCMGMSAFYKDNQHTATEEESIAVIHKAIELGVTLLDTSDIYGKERHTLVSVCQLSLLLSWMLAVRRLKGSYFTVVQAHSPMRSW